MQACIQDVERPDIDRGFSEVTVSRDKPDVVYKIQRSNASISRGFGVSFLPSTVLAWTAWFWM
jgi:hypothetical protein